MPSQLSTCGNRPVISRFSQLNSTHLDADLGRLSQSWLGDLAARHLTALLVFIIQNLQDVLRMHGRAKQSGGSVQHRADGLQTDALSGPADETVYGGGRQTAFNDLAQAVGADVLAFEKRP